MKKSELRQIIRKVLREEKVGDKEYSAEGPRWWCWLACVPTTFSTMDGYHQCVRRCKAAGGIREEINEQGNNPFNNPPSGAGTGPNWATAAAQWQNFYTSGNHNPSTAPSPPQAFLSRMATMGCPQKVDRYMVLMAKWQNQFPMNQTIGGVLPYQLNPNNPIWQSQLMAKITWLNNDLYTNC